MRALILLAVLSLFGSAHGVEQVRALALFEGKAMLQIDGSNRILQAGEHSPEGVLLVRANAREAEVELDGERRVLRLDDRVGGPYQTRQTQEVRLLQDSQGHYSTRVTINGQRFDAMVDTGAGAVVLNRAHADAVGIPTDAGRVIPVVTASGRTSGRLVRLERVGVAGIELPQVDGIVLEGDYPPFVLIGMTFLERLEIDHRSGLMVLRKRH